MKKLNQFDAFTRAYIVAALWTFDENAPSGDYETSGRPEILFPKFAAETVKRIETDCAEFFLAYGAWINKPGLSYTLTGEQAGCDFWLTRNGHGSGFWDRDALPEVIQTMLTNAAHGRGERSLYYGDNGKIYIS